MLAPVVGVSPEYGVATFLSPVTDSRKFRFGRWTGLPQIKHDRLAGLSPEIGQGRQGTIERADVQPKRHDIVMLLDQCADIFVTLGKQYLVDDGVRAHVHESSHF